MRAKFYMEYDFKLKKFVKYVIQLGDKKITSRSYYKHLEKTREIIGDGEPGGIWFRRKSNLGDEIICLGDL